MVDGIYGSSAYDFNELVERGWGTYKILLNEQNYQIRIVEVNPFSSIQNQLHMKRSEHWVIISGIAKLYMDGEYKLIYKGESAFIPIGMAHKVINPGGIPLVMIEIHTGDMDESDSVTI